MHAGSPGISTQFCAPYAPVAVRELIARTTAMKPWPIYGY